MPNCADHPKYERLCEVERGFFIATDDFPLVLFNLRQASASTNPSTTSSAIALRATESGQIFTTAGIYQGSAVAIKAINKPYIYLTREVIQEINEVSVILTKL